MEVDTHTHTARAGDVFLLCSDGLTGMVSDTEMESILRGADSLDAAAEALVRVANQSGGKDNITVVLFRLGEDGDGEGEDDEGTLSGSETIHQGLTADEVRGRGARARARRASGPGPGAAGGRVPRAGRADGKPHGIGREATVGRKPLYETRRDAGLVEGIVGLVDAAVLAGGSDRAGRPAGGWGDRRGRLPRRPVGVLHGHRRRGPGHALPGRPLRAADGHRPVLRALRQLGPGAEPWRLAGASGCSTTSGAPRPMPRTWCASSSAARWTRAGRKQRGAGRRRRAAARLRSEAVRR
ncbi:MAG: hypothetical protein WKF40_11175 [Thermoleophilaceae bacterium]